MLLCFWLILGETKTLVEETFNIVIINLYAESKLKKKNLHYSYYYCEIGFLWDFTINYYVLTQSIILYVFMFVLWSATCTSEDAPCDLSTMDWIPSPAHNRHTDPGMWMAQVCSRWNKERRIAVSRYIYANCQYYVNELHDYQLMNIWIIIQNVQEL